MDMVRCEVRLAVLGLFAQARRAAHEARPERVSTAWAFSMPRWRVW